MWKVLVVFVGVVKVTLWRMHGGKLNLIVDIEILIFVVNEFEPRLFNKLVLLNFQFPSVPL